MAFDAVGELAATPGGQELSALVARAQRVDPEALLGMGRGLAAMAEGVDGSMRSLGRHGDDVRAAWQGRGAEALTGHLDDVGTAGVRTLEATGRIRARIDGAGQELAGMRREVDGHVSRALDAARRARMEALADPARAPFADQLVARAMAEPTAAARASVVRAETLLGDAAAALRELAGDLSAFSRLPTPDARPFAPPGGAGPAATIPAFSGGGTQGIDLAGGGGGDFTDTSSLDSSGGSGCSGSSDGNASNSEASGAGGSSAGLDDAGDGGSDIEIAPEDEASGASDSSSGDDDFTGTSADLDDAGSGAGESDQEDASVPEASAASDSASVDEGFTGTSADLDDGGGDGSDIEIAPEDEAPDVSDSASADEGFTGTSADLDGSGGDGADASGAEASDASDSSSGDDDFTGTSADLDDAESGADDADEDEALVSEASDVGDSASGDDGFTGTSADLDDAGDNGSDTENASEDEASADTESGADDPDQDDASVSEASDAGDPSGDADSREDDQENDATSGGDAGGSDARDATDEDPEGGAVTSASTRCGDAASTTDAGDAAATPAGGPKGEVGDWIREALAILQAEGVAVDKMDPDDIATIIDHESGGDPEAINNWDSNADKGTPSQGLMQTIGPTFDSYKLDGHGEITDPVDNIIAGVRYAIARYGSVSEVPGVEAVARGDAYVGY